MPRANGSVPPEAIRIEDEVWEEAFTRREPSSDARRRRLRAIDGGLSDPPSRRRRDSLPDDDSDWLKELQPEWLNQSQPDSPVRASEPVTPTMSVDAISANATAPDLPAATWLGVSVDEAAIATAPTRATETATAPSPHARTAAPPPARRTVKIQGRGAERNLPLPDATRRRPPRRPYERAGFRPDRLAMWAVMLGFLLVFVAIISGHG